MQIGGTVLSTLL